MMACGMGCADFYWQRKYRDRLVPRETKSRKRLYTAKFECFTSPFARTGKIFSLRSRELKKHGIKFEFQDHEIAHSIYFRDPDGHQLEITTYDLEGVLRLNNFV